MKLLSRNINGIRAIIKKGFVEIIKKIDADIICLQEVKAFETQIPADMRILFQDYDYIWHTGERAGYSGTAILYKRGLQIEELKVEDDMKKNYEYLNTDGRLTQIVINGKVALLNIYFPNGAPRADGTPMLDFKLKYYDILFDYLAYLKKKYDIIVCGDFNIAHTEIDIARPKENQNSIGFLPEEREKISQLINRGFVDVFRYFYPDQKDKYTWRSYITKARARNVGWRLDYFFVNKEFLPNIKIMQHLDEIYGSDHCPIFMEIDI